MILIKSKTAHRVDLGALYQFLRVLQINLFTSCLFLTYQYRDRKGLELDPRIFYFTLHWIKIRSLVTCSVNGCCFFLLFLIIIILLLRIRLLPLLLKP